MKASLDSEIVEKEKAFAWAEEEELERRNFQKLLGDAESHRDDLLDYIQQLERRVDKLVASLIDSKQESESCKAMLEIEIAEKNGLRDDLENLQLEHSDLLKSLNLIYKKIEELSNELDRNESQLYLRLGRAVGLIKKIERPNFK